MKTEILSKSFPVFIFIVFFLMVAGVFITGILFYKSQQEHIKSEVIKTLSAIADLKADQILRWRKERLKDAALIMQNSALAHQIADFFKKPTQQNRKELNAYMQALQDNGYESVLLLDNKNQVRISKSPHGDIVGTYAKNLFEELQREKKVIFSDFHVSDYIQFPHLDLIIPIFSPDKPENIIIGFFLLRIDPRENLYPKIMTWPTPSKTSETILVRKDSNEVVYLNELRHFKNAPLTLRRPATDDKLTSAMAVQGIEGFVEGLDYRQVPVISAIKKIENSN